MNARSVTLGMRVTVLGGSRNVTIVGGAEMVIYDTGPSGERCRGMVVKADDWPARIAHRVKWFSVKLDQPGFGVYSCRASEMEPA